MFLFTAFILQDSDIGDVLFRKAVDFVNFFTDSVSRVVYFGNVAAVGISRANDFVVTCGFGIDIVTWLGSFGNVALSRSGCGRVRGNFVILCGGVCILLDR